MGVDANVSYEIIGFFKFFIVVGILMLSNFIYLFLIRVIFLVIIFVKFFLNKFYILLYDIVVIYILKNWKLNKIL